MNSPRRNPSSAGVLAGAALALGVGVVPATAHANCPFGVTWPEPDWPVDRIEGPAVEALDRHAFTLVGADEDRRGLRTDGLVVVHRGRIVYERYGRGFGPDNPHLTWSVSKSMLDAMLGVAIEQGHLGLNDSVCDYFDPVYACDMTPADLRDMASGLDWNEGYEDEPYYLSSVIAMLYGHGALDMAAFVGVHPSAAPPGTLYRYSSGDSVLLSAVLAGALPSRLHDTFPLEFIFEPIGMTSAIFEQDRAGTFVGSSYAYATPRDMARFGYLYLRDGCWEGQRLLPEGWVEQSTEVNPVFVADASFEWARDSDPVPGRHWWTNNPVPDLGIDSVWPDVPSDAYIASGHWGQMIAVIPSEDLVIARTADDREVGIFDKNRMLKLAMDVVHQEAR